MQRRLLIFSSLLLILGLTSTCSASPTISRTPENLSSETATVQPVTTPLSPLEIGSLGMGSAEDIAWTPDGQSLIVAGSQGLYLYDPQTWQLQKNIETPTDLDYGYPDSISVSQDGKNILFTGTGGIWQTDLESGQTTRVLRGGLYSDTRALYNRDRSRIALLRHNISNGVARSFYGLDILSTQNGEVLNTLIESGTTRIYKLKLSLDGHTLAVARADNLIHLFDLDTGEHIGTLAGHESDVLDMDFSPNGEYLASAGADATLRIWDMKTKQLLQTVRGFEKNMRAVTYAADGTSLLGLVSDGQIERWAIDVHGQASAQSTLFHAKDSVQTMVVQPAGRLLALLGQTGQIQVMNLDTGQIVQTFLEFGYELGKVTWNKAGDQIAAATKGWDRSTIFVWDVSTRKLLRRYELEIGSITDLAFSPDGKTLAAIVKENIHFWDLTSNYDHLRTESISGEYGKLAFRPDGQYLAVASRNFQVWKLDEGERGYHIVQETKISGIPIFIAYSPDGKTIALVTQEEVKTWDADSQELLSTWQPGKGNFNSNPIFRDAQLFWEAGQGRVTFSLDWNGVFFYHLDNGVLLYSMPSTQSGFSPFALDFSKRLLIIGGYTPRIIDAQSGILLWEAAAQKEQWTTLAIHPDGLRLATSEYGNTIRLWDIAAISQTLARLPAVTATAPPAPIQTNTPVPTQPVQLAMTARTPSAPQPGSIGPENLAQLTEFARLGKGGLLSLAWSPDNKYFALGTTLGVHVFTAQPYQEKGFVPLPKWTYEFALGPAGDKILTSYLEVWDVNTGRKLYQLALPNSSPAFAHYGSPGQFEFSVDGEWIYVDFGKEICTWKTDQEQSTGCRSTRVAGRDAWPLAISPDGQWAAFRSEHNGALIVNTQTNTVVHTFEHGEYVLSNIVFSPDGQTIAYASYEENRFYSGVVTTSTGKGRVELWQVGMDGTFTFQHTLETGPGNPFSLGSQNVFYTSDGKQLVLLNGNGELQRWDVRSGRLLSTIPNAGQELTPSPDRTWLLTRIGQEQAMLWKTVPGQSPQLVESMDWFSSEVTDLSISSDGSLFSASWMLNSTIQRWDLSVSNAPGPLQEFENASPPLSIIMDGSWLAAEAANGMAQIIETSSGKVLASFPAAPSPVSGPTPRITALVLSSDKRLLASLSSDWKIRLWDVRSGQLQREIAPQEFAASGLDLSPDGRYIAANGAGNNLAVWDTSSGEVIRYFDRGGGEIVFHPNGVQLASVREDGRIELLDLRTGTPTWVTNEFEVILSLAFSPDGGLLAMLNNDSIQFLDANSGELIGELPVASVRSLTFSPDGKILAIGCADGTIRLFHIK